MSSLALGPLEEDVMSILWEKKHASVREVLVALGADRGLAYTTVMTILIRLVEKGALTREKDGKSFIYFPKNTREQAVRNVVHQTIASFIDRFGEEAAAAFIDEADLLSHSTKKKK